MAKKPPQGAPMWLVTFADLMSLLVCFFVLIISFSVPDTEKLRIAAGSIRDAFGISKEMVVTGVVELDGNPIYKFAQQLSPIEVDEVVGPIPDQGRDAQIAAQEEIWQEILEQDEPSDDGTSAEVNDSKTEEERFTEMEAGLRQALQASPELERLAEQLLIESRPEGLRLELVDQARISMFPLGGARPYDTTTKLLAKVAEAVKHLPNRIEISGHTDSLPFRREDHYDNWSLSQARADATRRVLIKAGVSRQRFATIAGKADSEPRFPEHPRDPRNRRISITLLRDAPAPPAEP